MFDINQETVENLLKYVNFRIDSEKLMTSTISDLNKVKNLIDKVELIDVSYVTINNSINEIVINFCTEASNLDDSNT